MLPPYIGDCADIPRLPPGLAVAERLPPMVVPDKGTVFAEMLPPIGMVTGAADACILPPKPYPPLA